jgi:putative ABC transport system permease protein
MKFVLSMAVRETRSAWKRLLFFFVCIAIGVGAIVVLRSIIQSVRQVLTSQARSLIAADILLSTDRPWATGVPELIQERIASVPGARRTDAVEMPTMARPADERLQVAKVVELRAVQSAFPLYGQLTLADGRPYSHALLEGRGALVRSELLSQLSVNVGDAIIIGQQLFTIRGVIAEEPGRSLSAFSLGPRVLIDYADLAETGLLAFGSRVVRQVLVRLPEESVEPLSSGLRSELQPRFVRVRSYRDREEAIGEDFERAENYLSLVGLVIVILGGIAVSSVTRVFVRQKIKSIAVMKCVGASTRQILAVYLLQALALGCAGSLIGIAFAGAAIAALPDNLSRIGNFTVAYGLTPSAALQGFGIGILVALLFAMIPLLEVRLVKPSLLLRQDNTVKNRRDWVAISAITVVAVLLAALASWQAGSLRIGASVYAGFAGLTLVLHLMGWLLVRGTRPLAVAPWFPLRQAVLHLSRPGNQTRVILLTVGLGTFFIMGVRGLQVNLLEQFSRQFGDQTPDMFLLDIQEDQVAPLRTFLSERIPGTQPRLIPVMRARVTGRGVSLDEMEDVRGRGMLSREYVITYRDHIEPNETMRSWNARRSKRPPGRAWASERSLVISICPSL